MEYLLYSAAGVLGVIFRYQLGETQARKTIGAQISSGGDKKGYLQDAITPPSSTNLTLLTWALTIGIFVYAFFAFGWIALGIAVGTFLVVSIVAGAIFIPKPDSVHYVKRIYRSMANRCADYEKQGDTVRSKAMKELIDRVEQIFGHIFSESYAEQSVSTVASKQSSDAPEDENSHNKAKERIDIIADYGAFIEHNPPASGVQIYDLKCLPHDKEAILDAICSQIASEDDERQIEALKVGALLLADYQEGVGDQPISMLGVDLTPKDLASRNVDDIRALAAKIADNPDRGRFETYKPIVENDLARIQTKLLAAEQLRRQSR